MNWRFWPLQNKFFYALAYSSLLSPFRPFGHLSVNLDLLKISCKFNRNRAEEIWFKRSVGNTDENVAWQRWPDWRSKVAKPEEGRQGAAVTKCVKESFLKWPKSSIHAWLIPILWSFCHHKFCWLRKWLSKLKSLFFRGSFSQPTSKSKLVGEPD